jgi:hypothetical protein
MRWRGRMTKFHARSKNNYQDRIGTVDTLTGIRRRGPEEQAIRFRRGQRRRGCRRRNHQDPVRACHRLQDRAGHARAVAANHGNDSVSGDQTFGRRGAGRGIAAGRVCTDGYKHLAVKHATGSVDLGEGHFGALAHLRCQRFQRAGEAQEHADLDVFGLNSTRTKRGSSGGQQ